MKRILLSVLVGVSGLLAAVAWSESRSGAIYARADLREMGKSANGELGDTKSAAPGTKGIPGPFERLTANIDATLDRITLFSAVITLLSMAAITVMWLPRMINAGPRAPEANDSRWPADQGLV